MYLSGQCVCIVTCYMHTNVFIWTCEFVYINADHEYFLFFDRRWSTIVTNAIFTRVLTIGNVICRFDLYGHDCLSRIRARCQAQVERPCLVISTLDIRRSLRLRDVCTRYPTSPALVEIMSCHLFGSRPLSEPRLAYNQPDTWEYISIKRRLIQ